jgi:hypothetical protein
MTLARIVSGTAPEASKTRAATLSDSSARARRIAGADDLDDQGAGAVQGDVE